MKTLILKIKEVKSGGLFGSSYAILNPIAKTDEGEKDLGDYLVASGSDTTREKLEALKELYKKDGYELVGDWE